METPRDIELYQNQELLSLTPYDQTEFQKAVKGKSRELLKLEQDEEYTV